MIQEKFPFNLEDKMRLVAKRLEVFVASKFNLTLLQWNPVCVGYSTHYVVLWHNGYYGNYV